MSSLTEQFSAVTKSQLEAQFKIFNTFANTAVDSAEKVIALNLNTTKASVEKSSAAARKLLDAKDAQELFRLNAGQPSGFDHLLAYGRQLYSIATAAQTELLQSAQSGIAQAQELAKATPLLPQAKPLEAAPVAKPAPLASVAPVSAPAPADEAPPATLAAAVSAAVAAPDSAPVIAEASGASANEPLAVPPKTAKAPVKPKPAAAPIEPPAPAEVKTEVKPAAGKSSFPVPPPKPIALAPETKPSKLKEAAPKGKQLDMVSGGKGKK
jgi:phasin family protein